MILNENAGTHAFYQSDRRVRVRKVGRTPSEVATGNCPGHLEGRWDWMRRRQEWKREQKRLKQSKGLPQSGGQRSI